jgi:Ser/Thr protein kinase RdoA (MazF antagonist)
LVAQLHEFSSTWQPPDNFSRPTWDWDAQLGGRLFDVGLDELIDSMPRQFQEPFKVVSQKTKNAMEKLGQGADAFGLIHADLYPENILNLAGQAMPIDFEDCGYSYWIWDIAVALCTWAWEEHWSAMREAFHQGYQAVRRLPEEQWDLLDIFIAAQNATMLLWASGFLQHDPKRADEYIPWREDSGKRLLRFFQR